MPPITQPKSHFLTVNDLHLHYFDWGNTGAPPLLWVHGYTSSAEAFHAPGRYFQARYQSLALDVRGHGESAWSPTGAYQYSDQAKDIEGFVNQLGMETFALIGTSMGGIIAMTYAGMHPERLTRLVINDIGPDVEEGSQRITQMVGGRPDTFATIKEAMVYRHRMSPIVAGLSLAIQEELARGVLRQQTDGSWVWKMDPAYIQQRVQYGPPVRPNLWPVLAGLRCPTLVVWGTDSDVLSEAQAQRMVNVLPRGELVAVPGVGHAPTLMEPAALSALERFLKV
jgi:pimeloyl-ACP methyl ester carboxylesterase